MTKMIFVNLPVADLPKSEAFYTALDFTDPDSHVSGPFWMDAAAMPPSE